MIRIHHFKTKNDGMHAAFRLEKGPCSDEQSATPGNARLHEKISAK